MYKNWIEICKIGNPYFRLSIASSTDQSFLKKVALGFPELFTETKPEREGPFPLSYLRDFADRWDTQEALGEDLSTLGNGFELIGFPNILCAHINASVYDANYCIAMPAEIAAAETYARLSQDFRARVCFPYSLKTVVVAGQQFYVGWVNPDGVREDDGKDITLFPVELVDPNS